jgi:DNA-binding response OmpR family regulator
MGKKKILVVEDELLMRKSLEAEFQGGGFDVTAVGDGEAGLKAALQEHPDLIILDVRMPKKDGISMLRELKDDRWGNLVPVIILTDESSSERLAEALELGIEDYLIKSEWKLDDILEKVKNRLGGIDKEHSQ